MQVGLWHWGWNPCQLQAPGSLPGTVSTSLGLPSLPLAKVISPLEPTWSPTSSPDHLLWPLQLPPNPPVSELISPGGSPQPFWIGQNKESGYSGFSLIDSQLGVLEGWGSREVMWDVGGHESWQGGLEGEEQRLSNSTIRERAWSAQLTARQACSDTEVRDCSDTGSFQQEKICDFCFFSTPSFRMITLKKKIAFSVIVTRQQSDIYYPFEVIQKQPMRISLIVHCRLETETWAFILRNSDAKPQHSSTSSWSPDNIWHQDLFLDWVLYFVFRLPSGLLLS